MMTEIEKTISSIRALNIARIEDLPYEASPPVQFIYRSTATLAGGAYTWADGPTALTVLRPVIANALYYVRHITFSADIEELDFTAAITTVPNFQFYLKSGGNVQLFREPVYMTQFLQSWDYRLILRPRQQDTDAFRGSFRGVLTQTAALIGKATITLTAVLAAQEITDQAFIALVDKGYPREGTL